MQLVNLNNPKGYVLDPETIKPFDQMSATEVLSYFINNILVFEQKIFESLEYAVNRFNDVLDLSDRTWLTAFFFQKVYVSNPGNIISFNWPNAIAMKVVCEKLLFDKYAPREDGNDEMPVPQLPPPDQLDIGYLHPYFKRYIQDRIDAYNKIIDYYEQFRV